MNELQKHELAILKDLTSFLNRENLQYFLYGGTLLGAVRHQGYIPWDDDVDIVMKRSDFIIFESLLAEGKFLDKGYSFQSNMLSKHYSNAFSKVRNQSMNVVENVPKTQHGYEGPWVDIFAYDNIPDDIEDRKYQFKKVNKYNSLIKFFMLTDNQSDTGMKKVVKGIIKGINEALYKGYFFMPYLYKKRLQYMTMYNHLETKQCADLCYMFYKSFDDFTSTIVDNSFLENPVSLSFEDEEFNAPENFDTVLTRLYGDYLVIPEEKDRKIHKLEYEVNDNAKL